MLDVQHLHMMHEFQDWVGNPSGAPSEKVANLFCRLAVWANDPQWLGSGFSRVATELAEMPGHPARKAARKHKISVEGWLEEQLTIDGVEKPDQLVRQIMVLIEGSISLALIHGNTDYIAASANAAAILMARYEG